MLDAVWVWQAILVEFVPMAGTDVKVGNLVDVGNTEDELSEVGTL